ncbi:hypothetical protein BJ322DRAFT_1033917 [Thelephora terrestris]|uniref:Cytokinin riboside 5'-monophosphate phosphoribohydrolase n=1 Tax=Thelephora terrestris TaxID=56493 RepID=A0A9P6HTS1_9AGAM|nr:hypothetical protein BJ322DRAFT_1033917 [Thelephora terrestris]
MTTAVAVYCGASPGTKSAYRKAADSLGRALAVAQRPLVYGGGVRGIMGIVSRAALKAGGEVVGVIPQAILAIGEGEQTSLDGSTHPVDSREDTREKMECVVVDSMHERKVEMARRSCGFIGLPGGYGTFEEVFEVTAWTQVGIHSKPVVIANVLGFFDPIRALIQNAVGDGFIRPVGKSLIKFVDGPADHSLHDSFDWGKALLDELDTWEDDPSYSLGFDWTRSANSSDTSDSDSETESLDSI